jgi:ABC-type lipoprotein release transport system permease subunit
VNDIPMTVAGITGGTNLIATQFAFFDLAAVELASGYLSGLASFIVVDVAEGVDVESVRQELEAAHPDISAHHVEPFLQNNVEEAMAGFRPFQRLVMVVGLLAAAALVAMLIQSIVEDRKSELAIILAMGASLGSVVLALLAVALRTAALGVLAGSVLVVALTALTNRWFPTITVDARWTDGVFALAIFAAVSLVGAMLPALRLRSIDPVESFRP